MPAQKPHQILLLLTFAFTFFFATSCQQVRPPDAFTLFGGASRSGNFESGGSFTNATIISDFPKKNDSIAKANGSEARFGANMPPVPLSFIASYLTLLDGHAARYAGGRLEWKAPFDALSTGKRAIAAANPCTDKEDNLYVVANDGALYSFDKDGKRRWKQVIMQPLALTLFSDLLVVADGVIAGFNMDGNRGGLQKFDFNGNLLWKQDCTPPPTRTFAADESGNVIVALSANTAEATDTLVCFAANGSRRWAKGIAKTRLLRMPVLGAGQILIAGIRSKNGEREDVLFAFDASGNQRWEKILTFTPQGIATGTQGEDGTGEALIVVAGYRTGMGEALSLVLGFDAAGKELWRLSYNLAVLGAPMISRQNIVFVGTKGEAIGVYFMSKQGVFQQVVSMSDAPPLALVPSVDAENNILFTATEELGIVKIGKLPVQRILPY